MNILPDGNVFGLAIAALSEFAFGIQFTTPNVEQERGVVLEEWRTTLGDIQSVGSAKGVVERMRPVCLADAFMVVVDCLYGVTTALVEVVLECLSLRLLIFTFQSPCQFGLSYFGEECWTQLAFDDVCCCRVPPGVEGGQSTAAAWHGTS